MCTNFQIKAKDNSWIIGRTMEFASDLQSQFYIHKRGDVMDMNPIKAKGFNELQIQTPWSARYGYVGLNSYHLPGVVEGMNEAGLSIGALWLPGTVYQKVTKPELSVPAAFMCDWVLARCATVEDVMELLPHHQFWMPEKLEQKLPLHFPIIDATGKSIVVEFENGEQRVHNNSVGVCTNAPWFPWHLTNLGNFTNLTPNDPKTVTLGQMEVSTSGHGGGLSGLPGNATPASRFVRTAYLKQFANQPADSHEAIVQATHLLNDVDIPKGCVRDGSEEDYTQWATLKDLNKRIFAVRTYDSMQFRAINLKQIDFEKVKTQQFPIPNVPELNFITV